MIEKTEVEKYFVMDAENAVSVLDEFLSNIDNGADIETYEITVHGIKSALKNIGETQLSSVALNLEKAALENNLDFIKNNTQSFIDKLKELINNISNVKVKEEPDIQLAEHDAAILKEKLNEIINACKEFEAKKAREIIESIKQNVMSNMPDSNAKYIDDILDEINVHLLHSAFNKATAAAAAAADKCKIIKDK